MVHIARKLLALSTLVTLPHLGCSQAPLDEDDASSGEALGTSEEALCFTPRESGHVIRGASAEEARAFRRGKATFVKEFTAAEGLGPVFNERSCRNCHDGGKAGAVGGFGTITVTRFGRSQAGVFDGLTRLGGTLIQSSGIGSVADCNYTGEAVPVEANVVVQRLTQPLFGLGLVDAVPASTLRELAATQPASVRGRVAELVDATTGAVTVGKFGWKANVVSLAAFASGALNAEMGITSPGSPNETCPQGNCAELRCNPRPDVNDDGTSAKSIEAFMKLLAPPTARSLGAKARGGERLFAQLGCADCHAPTLKSGPSPIAALSEKTFHPYSDFLLHDMGSLGDGIPQGAARATEMRTAPLWGLGDRTRFLHDGRAESIEDAIVAHDGQGRAAAAAYAELDYGQKYQLLLLLKSL